MHLLPSSSGGGQRQAGGFSISLPPVEEDRKEGGGRSSIGRVTMQGKWKGEKMSAFLLSNLIQPNEFQGKRRDACTSLLSLLKSILKIGFQ